ncbi:MAG: aspartate aminotransferase family protein [Actinobacteria bacterium]|nr:aspartate aminotransferase family protein [Actinomycetota bacterium]MBM3712051.1 aspartate aminotransferase family protein [Actinomycetota bacterium]
MNKKRLEKKKLDRNRELYDSGEKFLMHTYSRLPVVFTRAKMQYLWDINGSKYLDFIAGYGCLNVGHTNDYVTRILKKQIESIVQPSNVYYSLPQIELAGKLCELTGFGKKVFFANSGTEAIECAIKLARKYSREKFSQQRYKIVSFYKSFHGRTMGALSATAQESKQKIFEPLLEGFNYASINDIGSVEEKIDNGTCAVLIELVQGEGGINISEIEFIKQLRNLCSEKKILLILDEVQTGFGRTGRMFAFQHYLILPDILVLAKSLGGGMPLGAVVTDDEISSAFEPGSHGSTFGGNAASCAAGCAVIDYILDKDLIGRAEALGKYLLDLLKVLSERSELIKEVRGMGLMIGVELKKPVAGDIVKAALNDRLIINKVSDYVLRFLPPLIIAKKDIDRLFSWLKKNLKKFEN